MPEYPAGATGVLQGIYVLPLPRTDGGDDGSPVSEYIASTPVGSFITAPPGALYNVENTVVLLGNRTYDLGMPTWPDSALEPAAVGSSGALFRQAAGANLDYVVATAAVMGTAANPVADIAPNIRSICIDGNRTNQTGGAGHNLGVAAWGATVGWVGSVNARGHGIVQPLDNQGGFAFSGSNGNCYENTYEGHIKISGCGGHGFYSSTAWSDGTITGHMIVSVCGLSGISIYDAAGWHVTGAHVWNVGTDGILTSGAYATRIHDNYVEGFGALVVTATTNNPWTYSAYSAGTTYARYQCVTYSGGLYYSLIDGNVGNTPSTSFTDWASVNPGATGVYGMAFFSMGVNRPTMCHDNTVSVGHVTIAAIAGINYRAYLAQSNTSGTSYLVFHHNTAENEYANGQAATAMAFRAAIQSGGALTVQGVEVGTGSPVNTGTNTVVGTFSQANSIDAGVTAWAGF